MIKVGQEVFPRWSQFLPAFIVSRADAVMITVVDKWGNREFLHRNDVVVRDPAVEYPKLGYVDLG